VTGKLTYFDDGHAPHRFAYYLQSGNEQACLIIEKGRSYDCLFSKFVEGSLDSPNKVPTKLTIGDVAYQLENYRKDKVTVQGNTDFRANDGVLYWRYLAQGNAYFILQWQDGKYVALEAERIPPNSIR